MGRRKTNSKTKLISFVILAFILCIAGVFALYDKPTKPNGGVIEQNATTNVIKPQVILENAANSQ